LTLWLLEPFSPAELEKNPLYFSEEGDMMLKIIVIGLGGFIGAILRYMVAGGVQTLAKTASFPTGTLTVNVAGCLLIGFGGGLMESRQLFSPEWRAFLFIGILGSFTTFSTFGLETFNLVKGGQWLMSAGNVGLSVVLGLAAVIAGHMLSRLL
jgi:CrcB protein